MSNLWTAQEIAAATGGRTSGEWVADSVVIDSRKVTPGALFIALPGSKSDGHDHVRAALEAGAVAAVVSRPVAGVAPSACLIVADTEQALQQLGEAARARSTAKFIGITGSVGKTGAKEMLACALRALGRTHATAGNYNNHLGLPLTLANLPRDTEYAVLEMGMNHPGEIARLSHWARPDVSLVTTVAAVHIEFFNSVAEIADEKISIVDGMGGRGTVVLNRDNDYYSRMAAHAERQGLERILGFGTHSQAPCCLTHYRLEEDGSHVEARICGTPIAYQLGTVGKHWALTSLAVLGVVVALGGDLAKAAAMLRQFREPKGRGEIRRLGYKGGQLRLVDDAYNASPVSVEAAITKLAELRAATSGGCRTLVVLGDMLELGEHAQELHVGLAPALINNQMDLVFAAGSFMEKLYNALPEPMRGAYRATSRELAPQVVAALKPSDLVLVKGSRGMQMETVVRAIEENADAS